ncbi:alpha/beta hydrolase [Streptomyces sp. PsTaAH-124]|uniref:alpha/beta hydrolase n=1 Tax=Streptomyces sp. PsTaAH-124 TaxID=1157638 RepID=UPI00037FC6D7|nr:alpha/beta hydrolase [Streptomyces sp. PsTaAH-124]
MISLDQLRNLKLSELTDEARSWSAVSNRSYASRDRVTDEIAPGLSMTQVGDASFWAIAGLGRLSNNYQYIYTECGLIAAALTGLAEELAPLQRNLLNALQDAKQAGFEVYDDGSVRYPETGSGDTQVQGGTAAGKTDFVGQALGNAVAMTTGNRNAVVAQEIADTIASALSQATEIDEQYAKAIRRLQAAEGLDVTESTWADVSGDTAAVHGAADDVLKDGIPTDRSPAERKDWWNGLSKEEQTEYLAVYPDVIGNLDGIPAVSRDEANRLYLPQLMGKLEAQGDEASMTKLDGLRGINDQLGAGGQPPMLLLGVGDQGNGRAIVSFGDPDTSKNVSAYVPGLGTKLDGGFADGTVKRARDTAVGAREIDPSSASIVWLGYDAPQGADVAGTGDAQRGAPAYQSFMGALATTNENADPHLTAIGHSYGSLTVGTASQQPGGMPDVDDYILLGSPGVGVDHAEDLGVGKQHVFVGAAENDLVSKAPSKGSVAGGVIGGAGGFLLGGPGGAVVGAGAGAELGDLGDDDNWFGKDPASEAFGATRFRTEDGPNAFTQWTLEAHSNYFNPEKDQMSADSIANIVAGNPGGITPEARR